MTYQILLVDDDKYFRSEFKEFMREMRVIEATNRREVLAILKKPHDIDLIILDEMLAEERGTEILPEIRKWAAQIDIIILTGHSSKDTAINALRVQASDFIEKPLTPKKIRLIKSKILAASKGQKDSRLAGKEGKIARAKYFAQRNYDKKLTLNEVAHELSLSPKYFSRLFKQHTCMNFSDYRLKFKIKKAKELLDTSHETIEQISVKMGYENPDSFIKVFKKFNDGTPNEYRNQVRRESKIQAGIQAELKRVADTIVHDAKDAIIEIDRSGKILVWTPSAEKLYGWTAGEAIHKNITDYIPPRKRKETSSIMAKLRKGMDIQALETQRRTKMGRVIDVSITLNASRDEQGKLQKIVSIERDITARKKERLKLIREKETAEQLVEEKTKELQKTQSVLKKEKYLSDIGRLASMVAHELRNPLNVIQTAIWNIKKKNHDPALKDNIKSIEQKLAESESIIDSLLKYAKIKIPVKEEVKICEILDECVETMEKRFRKRKKIITRQYPGLWNVSVEVDPLQMKQIFNNLLSNSYQALKGKKGSIFLIGQKTNKGYIEIFVKDNGPGIQAQFLNKVFDPFFSRRVGGTGLGLTVCKQLIELHKGEIHVASEEGQGMTVTVRLPAYKG